MKEILLRLTGTTPLMMHNERLANPLDEFSLKIKKITSKRSKTEDDYAAIEQLEWFGGVYEESGVAILPSRHVRKCLENAGKIRKLGKTIQRAVITPTLHAPLTYPGPRDLKQLWEQRPYRDVRAVGVGTNRVMRCRPHFPQWSVAMPLVIATEVINMDDFQQIAELAGKIEGIGDGRTLGFGRFNVEIGGKK